MTLQSPGSNEALLGGLLLNLPVTQVQLTLTLCVDEGYQVPSQVHDENPVKHVRCGMRWMWYAMDDANLAPALKRVAVSSRYKVMFVNRVL